MGWGEQDACAKANAPGVAEPQKGDPQSVGTPTGTLTRLQLLALLHRICTCPRVRPSLCLTRKRRKLPDMWAQVWTAMAEQLKARIYGPPPCRCYTQEGPQHRPGQQKRSRLGGGTPRWQGTRERAEESRDEWGLRLPGRKEGEKSGKRGTRVPL